MRDNFRRRYLDRDFNRGSSVVVKKRKVGRSQRKCTCGGTLYVVQTVTTGRGDALSVLRRYRCNKCKALYNTNEAVESIAWLHLKAK